MNYVIDNAIDGLSDEDDSGIYLLSQSSSCSTSSSQFVEEDYHLKSSIPSNVIFLLGSVLYLKLSHMDLIDANSYYDNNNEDYDDDYDDDYYYNQYINKYTVISGFGALLFVFNAIWDIYWCFGREREWREQIDAGYESDDEEENEAYHREERQNLISAITFGIAGLIDLAVSFINNEDVTANFTIITANIYLLSAISALKGTILSCPSIPTGLALIGDLLFFLGSLIDVAVSLISDPEIFNLNDRILAKWGCVSSTLWLINAVLYFAADITVIWYRSSCCCVRRSSASVDYHIGYTRLTL